MTTMSARRGGPAGGRRRPARLALALGLLAALALSGCGACKRRIYDGVARDRWQHPERVLGALGLAPGAHVADLGAGGGYFTFRLAEAVGPAGIVYAVDVDPDMTDYLARRARKTGHNNVRVLRVPPDDLGLPPGSLDLLFTCNTYHHLDDPVAYFRRARAALRPGGRVAIIDLDPERSTLARLLGHAVGRRTVEAQMAAAGYSLERAHDFLPAQSFLVFIPAPEVVEEGAAAGG